MHHIPVVVLDKVHQGPAYLIFTQKTHFYGVGGHDLVLLDKLAVALQKFGLHLVQIGVQVTDLLRPALAPALDAVPLARIDISL